mgnify:CR=1 FL=1
MMSTTGESRLRHHRSRRLLGWLVGLAGLAVALVPAWVLAQGVAPTDNPVLSLAVAPNAPNEAVAGTLNSPRPAGIFRTADGGVTWTNTTPDLAPNISITALAYDARNARTIFAADGGSGLIFRSSDGGTTWAEIPGFRDLLSANSAVGELYAVVESGRPVLYAGTRFDGVFRTADGGYGWSAPRQFQQKLGTLVPLKSGLLVGAGDNRSVDLLDYSSGSGKWGKNGKGINVKGILAGAVEIGDRTLLTSGKDDGVVTLVDASGNELWKKPVKLDGVVQQVTMLGNDLLVASAEEVEVIEQASGLSRLEKPLKGGAGPASPGGGAWMTRPPPSGSRRSWTSYVRACSS